MIDSAVEDNAGSDASSECRVKNITVAARRAPSRFSQRGGVGVVVHFDRHAVLARHGFAQRKISPAGNIRRIQNYASCRIERARGTNADSANLIRPVRIDRLRDGLQSLFRTAIGRHGSAALRDDFPRGVDQAYRNFGPPDIDPHYECLLVAHRMVTVCAFGDPENSTLTVLISKRFVGTVTVSLLSLRGPMDFSI